MLILGVDTSGRNGTIALVEFGEGSPRTLEVVPLEGGTFSAQLVPQISDLLLRHNMSKRDLDGFAVVSGPGSFTGLRVGLAAIKALAEVLERPIAPVSLLEAIARASSRQGEITALVDAGRGEVYAGDFRISESQVITCGERHLELQELASIRDRAIVTTDLAIAEFARQAGLPADHIPYPRADSIARFGFDKITAGDTVSALDLDANYIRPSEAEIKKASPG
ncbi:MAG: tRNA (adenosine(37)-N6)-threonylcarbamoyltransferase complex dimerization subunit type 1 TsaB [Acidobacteria bacterium]|nr:tRNA (adenosine(37)-N6)-threonylcarbamoyltransferase complex dimerization subunit type 1 TsaB [Acidobacteriota bacterium]